VFVPYVFLIREDMNIMATKEEILALYEEVAAQEEQLCYSAFSKQDALTLGLRLVKEARARQADLAIEIGVNGVVWFSALVGNANADNQRWMARKRRVVEMKEMSSYRYGLYLQLRDQTIADQGLDPVLMTDKGGGFPIRLAGTGVIGYVCVSGLPHTEDHAIICDALKNVLHLEEA